MPVTQNFEFPLYDPDDSPDLTLTGREAGAIIAIDEALKNEESGRKAADKVLTDNLANEVADREAADTALGGRIDNAEAEISANSADITGIKGLTYGNDHVAFLENNAGEYSSPALQEIAGQISAISGGGGGGITGDTTWAELEA